MTASSYDGKRFAVPVSRRLSWDLLAFNHSVPLSAHDRMICVPLVANARSLSEVRIGWPTLFLKAFAIVAQQIPEFRRIWYRWPWAHLYQSPCSVAAMTMERIVDSERWLFWARIQQPDQMSLSELQSRIDAFREQPAQKAFASQWRLAHLPTPLRRLIWWCNLNLVTRARVRRLGTFFLSTLASRGAEIQLPPSIHTCCLTYGPVHSDGTCRVTIAYDHRVMDGAVVADGLKLLEETLQSTILNELKQLSANSKADRQGSGS